MALPATEAFTGASGALSGSWTQQKTTGTVNRDGTGLGRISGAVDGYAFWNADVFGNDQYSQVVISSGLGAGTNWAYCTLRNSTDVGDAAFDGMEFYTDSTTGATHCAIAKNVNGVLTDNLATFATTFTGGDVMRFEVVGQVYTAFKNGVAIGSFTDGLSTFTSGRAGVGGFGTSVRFDSWEGGNIAYQPRDLQHSPQHQSFIAQ